MRWQDRVLVVRVRAEGFELPKGHVESGETNADAALRELAEETALDTPARCGPPIGEITYAFSRNSLSLVNEDLRDVLRCALA